MSMIRKNPLRGRLFSAVGTDRRPAGQQPASRHYYLKLRVEGTDESGNVAYTDLELSHAQVSSLLRHFPSAVVADMLSDRDKARVKGTFDQEFPNGLSATRQKTGDKDA